MSDFLFKAYILGAFAGIAIAHTGSFLGKIIIYMLGFIIITLLARR